MLALAVFLVAKYLAYSVFCMYAPRWLDFNEYHPIRFGLTRGAIRLLIGFVGMFAIAFLVTQLDRSGLSFWAAYPLSFAPVRLLEWLALYFIIALPVELSFRPQAIYWILAGVVVSFLCDGLAMAIAGSGISHLRWSC